jgi:hypothetical protein
MVSISCSTGARSSAVRTALPVRLLMDAKSLGAILTR